jgi:hypothetical protein
LLNSLTRPTVSLMVIWQDPPTGYRRSTKWSDVGEQLRANPHRWAKVCERLSSRDALAYVGKIRRGVLNLGAGPFEATSHGRDVYARYVGTKDVALLETKPNDVPAADDAVVAA